jgi:hypothetical protein
MPGGAQLLCKRALQLKSAMIGADSNMHLFPF